jgi:hypothetical protein|nr:MAG TPA: Head fiber protein [Caudoviricetes sp.]
MVNKTTRIRTTQAPTVATYDLTNQLNGVTQTFTLPVAINSQANHYLICSNQVYRNSAARIYYTISSDGRTLTTQLGDPIINAPGVNLQLVASDYAEGSGEPITETTLLGHLSGTLANAKQYTDDKVGEIKNKVDELNSFDIQIVANLPTTNISTHTIYLTPSGQDQNNIYDEFIYVNGEWEAIGMKKTDLSNYYNKQEVDAAIANAGGHAADAYTKAEVDGFLNNKVSKEASKGLSTNDYTTAEKDKLAGVEAQANKTVVDAELSNFSINPVQNKVIKAELDSIIGGKADKNSVYTQTETDNLLDLRVIKENGMSLSTNDFTTELKDKLTAIEDAAQVNKIEEIKTADGVALTITDKSVTLPAATATAPAVDAYTKTQSDDKYVAKEAGKTLTSNDFTDELKTKLEGVANNANKNVQADWNEADTDSDAFIKNKPVIPAGSVLYDATGTHTDGSITQKVITEELNKKVDKVDGKGLSTNDFTNELKDKLNAVNENGEANVLNGIKTADGNELTIADKKVTLPNFALKSDISSVYKVKGSKANKAELDDIVDKEVGDVYNLADTGVNYVWTGTEWDSLSGNVDLTGYYPKTEADGKFVAKEAGKGLSTNDLTNELKAKIENTKSGGIYLTTARLAQTIGQSKVIAIENISGLSADKVVVNETIIYDDSNGIGVVEAIAGNALKVKTISLGLIVNTKNEIQLAYAQDFYSQHEQTIGYYMGKPLYQITIPKLFPSKPGGTQEVGVIPGLERVVEVDGVVMNAGSQISYLVSHHEMGGTKFINVTGDSNSGKISITVGSAMPNGSYLVELTIKYTKKTDSETTGDREFINQALISRPDLWTVGKTYALGDGLMGTRFKGTVPAGGKVTLAVPTSFGTSVTYRPNVRTIYNSFVTVRTKKGEIFETHPAGYYGENDFITPLYCPQYDGYNLAFETSPNYVGHDFNAWALFSARGAA